jgi:hypothetical protein
MDNISTPKRSRFMQAVLLGAVTGAAISLFDRRTRNSVMNSGKRYMDDMKSMATHPDSALNQVKEASSKLRTTIDNISQDLAFITTRIEEMKDIPPQVAQMIKETKDAFVSDEGIHHLNQEITPVTPMGQSTYVSSNVQH